MSYVTFPDGISFSQRYVQPADLIPQGTNIPTVSNFYTKSQARAIKIKYNILDGAAASEMFSSCNSLIYISGLDVNSIKGATHMFANCPNIVRILDSIGTDFINVTNASYMFQSVGQYSYPVEIPNLNIPKCVNMNYMFQSAYIKKIGDINSPLATTMSSTFSMNNSFITSIGLVDVSSVGSGTSGPFSSTFSKLKHLGGFKNLKSNWTSYSFDKCSNLTVESLMNVINNAWDWTDYPDGKVTNPNGQTVSYGTTHKLVLGSTNLAKLTDEQKAIATNKGWTLS